MTGEKTSITRWERWRRLSDAEAARVVAVWQHAIGVRQRVRLERISRAQVSDWTGRRGCSLVGVSFDAQYAQIYHTRALTLEDIVHELLHVAHPSWSEEAVIAETDRLLQPAIEVVEDGSRAAGRRSGTEAANQTAGGRSSLT